MTSAVEKIRTENAVILFRLSRTDSLNIVYIVFMILLLLAIIFLNYKKFMRAYDKEKLEPVGQIGNDGEKACKKRSGTDKKGDDSKKKDERSLCFLIDSLIETGIQVMIVVIGAVIAIECTSFYEMEKEKDNVLKRLQYSSMDLSEQGDKMQKLVKMYQDGSITLDDLQLNAEIDLSLVEDMLFRDDLLRILPPSSYSMLLNEYRSMDERLTALGLDIYTSSEALLLNYEKISEDISFYARIVELVVQYQLEGQISEEEYEIEMGKIYTEKANDPDVIITRDSLPEQGSLNQRIVASSGFIWRIMIGL